MANPLKMLGNMGNMMKLQQQAQAVQKELEKEEFTVEQGRIKVIITGAQKVVTVQVDGTDVPELTAAINSAIQMSQQAAAAKLQEVSKQLGLG
ncbi:hypothetical protein C4579_03400 [Candidatus Microgenomates bacterium]|nr:MAG: hypothetical protein C4579_03400 [Candidatus Microgenomates bacterium]